MAQIECFNCGTKWDLGKATTNRCPTCGWIHEIYADRERAERVAEVYNDQEPRLPSPSGVRPLIGLAGYSVSFPDQGRLAEVAAQLVDLGL